MSYKQVLGIDIGGSGIKGAPVNTKSGKLLEERHRVATPQPSNAENFGVALQQIINHFKWKGAVGIGFPSVVMDGKIKTAANIDDSWIGTNAQEYFSELTKLPVLVLNDADAAGYAEMKFGAGKKVKGTVIVLTVGTGIGSAIFTNGKLIRNSEFGHLTMHDMAAEKYTSDAARKEYDLNWDDWMLRFNEYLKELERLFNPKLIIVGGGISNKWNKVISRISLSTPIQPAKLKNNAGIIGAAVAVKKENK